MTIPILALTMGDPAGVGPEIIAKALGRVEDLAGCLPFVVGDYATMQGQARYLQPEYSFVRVASVDEVQALPKTQFGVYQPHSDLHGIVPGQLSAQAGQAAAAYVYGAIALAKEGAIQGIVTAPLNKAALHMGGDTHPGHTEMLAEGFGVENYAMVLAAEGSYVFHVTTHCSLRDAIGLLTVESVLQRIVLAHLLAKALGQEQDAIGVAGVNPHAGENGLFGTEERDILAVAVEQAKAQGIPAVGPLPADVLFPQMARGKYHFAIAMYHDQGHAVFKALYFDTGVNITIGLPVIRTSVDHGTAFDIAGKGIAQEQSMIEAILLAAKLGPSWKSISEQSQ